MKYTINDLNDIDTTTPEGELLFAALSVLTVAPELHILKEVVNGRKVSPWQMIEKLNKVASAIKYTEPEPEI